MHHVYLGYIGHVSFKGGREGGREGRNAKKTGTDTVIVQINRHRHVSVCMCFLLTARIQVWLNDNIEPATKR